MNHDLRPAAGSNEPAASAAKAGRQLQAEATSPAVVSATVRIAAGFGGVVGCIVVLGILAAIIRRQDLNGVDAAITPFLHGLASPALDTVMQTFTFIGSTVALVPLFVLALIGLIWLRRPRREWLFLTVALTGSIVLDQVLKLIFQRVRPQLPWATIQTDYSFPSGHSMESFVFYVSVALLAWLSFGRRIGLIAITGALILVAAIGVSRIYLGYHYFTDVVGGFAAGLLWLLVVSGIFEIAPRLRRRWWPGTSKVQVPSRGPS